MTDKEQSTSGADPGLAQEPIALLRGVAEALTRFAQHLPSASGALPLPGTISAAQRPAAAAARPRRRLRQALLQMAS
jgi:hypothetical protein